MVEDRRAIVVGGAGGIGAAISRRLAADGFGVVIADYNEAAAAALSGEFAGEGHDARFMDVTIEASVGSVFDEIETSGPAAVLVIATGGPMADLMQQYTVATLPLDDWNRTLQLNLTGTFLCTRKFAQLRRDRPLEQARLVIIGSSVGVAVGKGPDISYVASKAAIFGFTRQVAFELAPAGITVNSVAPGPVATEEFIRNTNPQIRAGMVSTTLFNRFGTPEEVAGSVAYLVSAEAANITGSTLDNNGGVHMR